MFLSDVSIRRPVLATVANLLLMAFGLVAYTRMQVREYPDIETPVVSVSASYPGAAAEVVETQVRVFDHRLLPAPIRDNPAYWRSRPMIEVLCHEIEGSTPHAPVALARGAAKPLGLPLQ